MSVTTEFEVANSKFASTFDKGHLGLPIARNVIVITCMDGRVDPAAMLGLEIGDAHVSHPLSSLISLGYPKWWWSCI
jgi:carbonic anhydrase